MIKKLKLKSFQNHIEAAIDLNIPLIVHSRSAENETYDILKKIKKNLKILCIVLLDQLNLQKTY